MLRFMLVGCVLLFSTSTPLNAADDPATTARKQELLDFEKKWELSLNAADVKTVETMVADEFVIIGPAGNIVDRATYLKGIAKGREGQVVKPKVYEIKFLKDDVAIVYGEVQVKGPRNGREIEFTLIWTDVMVHRDGRWLCAWCHACTLNPKWDEPFYKEPAN